MKQKVGAQVQMGKKTFPLWDHRGLGRGKGPTPRRRVYLQKNQIWGSTFKSRILVRHRDKERGVPQLFSKEDFPDKGRGGKGAGGRSSW